MAMEINLDGCKNEDHIQVKLETTYMFWDLDYAGMDFSENSPYESSYIAPASISKSGGLPVKAPDLANQDIRLTDKEQLDLDFAVKPAGKENLVNSYFLVGNGYYHDITRYPGKARLDRLAMFSKKGGFDKFSRETFDELVSLINLKPAGSLAAKNN